MGNLFEHEDLDGEVRVDVAVAHEAHYLASCELLDLFAHLGPHDVLPALADVENRRLLPGGDKRPLALREVVLEHYEDAVLTERGLCFGRAPAGGLGEHVHDRRRDRRAEFAACGCVLIGHVTSFSCWVSVGVIALATVVCRRRSADRSSSNHTELRGPVRRPQRSASSCTSCSPRPDSASSSASGGGSKLSPSSLTSTRTTSGVMQATSSIAPLVARECLTLLVTSSLTSSTAVGCTGSPSS